MREARCPHLRASCRDPAADNDYKLRTMVHEREAQMPRVTCHMSVSIDGFVAGPDQSPENPLGRGGLGLHHWHLEVDERSHPADIRMRDELLSKRGAYVMGRNMFGPIRGDWGEEDWRGWWGPEPPYHAPVF